MSEQSQVRRKMPLVAAAAVTMEGLELRSLYNGAAAVVANSPTPKVFQGEIVQVDFSGPTAVTGWTINWGDGTTAHLPADRSHATHQYASTGSYSATISAVGASAEAAKLPFKIVNAAPDVSITGAPTTGVEGEAISLGSQVSDANDPSGWVYGWTLYRNGKHFIVPSGTDISSPDFNFTPTDDGTYVARLTVLDGQGGVTSVRTGAISVANAAPTGSIAGTPHRVVDDGRTIYLTAAATDAGVSDTITYNWTVSNADGQLQLAHADARTISLAGLADGSYVVNCTVTDNQGASTELTATSFEVATTVSPTAVTVNGLSPSGQEGTAVSAHATIAGPSASPDDTYRWSVTKDGQPYTLPTGTDTNDSSFTFTPNDNGQYVVKLIASDDNGIFGIATSAVTVANVAPLVDITGEPSSAVDEGSTVHLTTAVTDAGVLDTHTYAWSITKDGQPWTPAATVLTGASLDFVVPDNGEYVASVTVSDNDGGVTIANSQPITVRNVAPAVTVTAGPTASKEGSPVTLGSMVSDAGIDDTETYSWSVTKNGQPYAMASTTDLSSPDFTFVPNDNGTYVATLEVTDKDGGQTTAHSDAIAVANVAPTGGITGITSANTGDVIDLTSYGRDAGTADTLTYTWHATRNGQAIALNGTSTSVSGTNLQYSPSLAGDYTFAVTITDDDGGQTVVEHNVTVAYVAPRVVIAGPSADATVGDTLTYRGFTSDPGGGQTLTYSWSIKHNGATYTPAGVPLDLPTLSFVANDAGDYVASLTVSDGVGGAVTSDSGITTVTA